MATAKCKRVDLGFVVEDTEDKTRLLSHFFPSKIGGKPAWLGLKSLPSPDDLKCSVCGCPAVFLLQAYAPIDTKPSCFHRTLFIFICRNPSCCKPNESGNFTVFRSQLPRQNEFYSDKAPGENNESGECPSAAKYQSLCLVCGCAGSKKCGKCQLVTYCTKEHQVTDWATGGHKRVCGAADGESKLSNETVSDVIFKEYELDYGVEYFDGYDDDDEEDDDDDDGDKDVAKYYKNKKKKEKSNEERMEEYKKYLEMMSASGGGKDGGITAAELEKMALTDEDKTFTMFKKRVAAEPEQVLRYERGGQPLCITDKPAPLSTADIPTCPYCGSNRKFEFQIMPQLLTYLDVDRGLGEESLDWGIVAVYTCEQSCDKGGTYGKEFIWKQDIVSSSADKQQRSKR